MASNAPVSSMTTIYGATRTTTFSTRLTASHLQTLVTIEYPWPAVTAPPEHMTRPPPPDPASRDYPEVLPVLVLTQVAAIIKDDHGNLVNQATRIQLPPSLASQSSNLTYAEGGLVPVYSTPGMQCSDWGCWSRPEKSIIAIATAIIGPLILMLICILCCCGTSPTRVRIQRPPDGGRDVESQRPPRRRGLFLSFMKNLRLARRDTVRRSMFSLPSDNHGIRMSRLPPHPREPGPLAGAGNRSHRGVGESHIDTSSTRVNPGSAHSLSATSDGSRIVEVGSDSGEHWQPPNDQHFRPPSPLIPQGIDIRDFAYQAAGGFVRNNHEALDEETILREAHRRPGAMVVLTARNEVRNAARAPVIKVIPPSRPVSEVEKRRRSHGKLVVPGDHGQSQGGMRADHRRHGSGAEVDTHGRSAAEVDGGGRGRDNKRKTEERRARSLSPPRETRPKHKRSHSEGPSRLWALLPMALEALHEISEPKDGWEQYHKDKESPKSVHHNRSHKYRHESSYHEQNTGRKCLPGGGHNKSEQPRGLTAVGKNGRCLPPTPQPPTPARRRSNRDDARARHHRRQSTGLDGANSTDEEEEWLGILDMALYEDQRAKEKTLRMREKSLRMRQKAERGKKKEEITL